MSPHMAHACPLTWLTHAPHMAHACPLTCPMHAPPHASRVPPHMPHAPPHTHAPPQRWIAFQLLHGLAQCQEAEVTHGDIKAENVGVTSWGWAYLLDFAPYKPTCLPEDNPVCTGRHPTSIPACQRTAWHGIRCASGALGAP